MSVFACTLSHRLGQKGGSMKKIGKKLLTFVLAMAMAIAMTVPVFATTPLPAGTYTADQNIYKTNKPAEKSMGDEAVCDLKAEITSDGSKVTLVVHSHEIERYGFTGHLTAMTIGSTNGVPSTGTTADEETDYIFTFNNLDASLFDDTGCTLAANFTINVSIMPVKASGLLVLSDFTKLS